MFFFDKMIYFTLFCGKSKRAVINMQIMQFIVRFDDDKVAIYQYADAEQLSLADAVTIHKSQGMGFDQAKVFLGNGCFANGQLYTALSRCRTLKGLQLERRIFKEDVLFDENVVNFYKQLENSIL